MKRLPKSPVKEAVAEGRILLADSGLADDHLASFVNTFIEQDRRDRWLYFFLRRSPRAKLNSPHRIETHLVADRCGYKRPIPLELFGYTGVVYDLASPPALCTLAEAREIIYGHDAIFSWAPGKLALFQSHEGDWWLCQQMGPNNSFKPKPLRGSA